MSSTHHSIAVLLACSSAALCGCGSDEGARAAGGDDGSGGSSSSHSDHSAGAGATGSGGTGAGGTTTSGSGGGDEGPNDFFEELAQRPETVFAYSLRTQAEVEQYTHGDNDPALLRYDEEMDAARITARGPISISKRRGSASNCATAGPNRTGRRRCSAQ